jgi:hypothetical protein
MLSTCERTEKTTVFVPPALPQIVAPKPPPRVISSELKLVFREGDFSYLYIGLAENVAMEQARREWIGKEVYVDNDCTAKVIGLQVVERSVGPDDEEQASPVEVVGALLDRCDGTYARSTSLPMVVVPETLPDDAELVDRAQRELVRSAAAEKTQRSWVEEYQSTESWKARALYDIRTLRHPLTNQTWISIHAWNERGCGEGEVNIWGLFRVEADGSLTTKQLRDLGVMTKIDQIIDIEGDGEMELIGSPWIDQDVVLTRASGETLDVLPLPFIGCPC